MNDDGHRRDWRKDCNGFDLHDEIKARRKVLITELSKTPSAYTDEEVSALRAELERCDTFLGPSGGKT